jgi:hypothetical protein
MEIVTAVCLGLCAAAFHDAAGRAILRRWVARNELRLIKCRRISVLNIRSIAFSFDAVDPCGFSLRGNAFCDITLLFKCSTPVLVFWQPVTA